MYKIGVENFTLNLNNLETKSFSLKKATDSEFFSNAMSVENVSLESSRGGFLSHAKQIIYRLKEICMASHARLNSLNY